MVHTGDPDDMRPYDLSPRSIGRFFLLFFLPFTAYSLSLLPPVASFVYVWPLLNVGQPLHVMLLPFILTAEFMIFILFVSLVPGLYLKLLKIRVEEGEHHLSIKDKNFFNFSLHVLLYRPPLHLLNLFKLLPLRRLFLRLAGLTVSSTALLPGTEVLYDPYVTEIGDHTLVGSYAKIAGHLVEDRLVVKKVRIGSHCLIGADVFIMPGAVIEDHVVVGAKSLVLKDQVLKQGRVYAGNPSRDITEKVKKKPSHL